MSEDRSFAAVFGEPFFKIFVRNAQRVNAVTEAIPSCKSSKDHSKPRNEVDTSLKSPV